MKIDSKLSLEKSCEDHPPLSCVDRAKKYRGGDRGDAAAPALLPGAEGATPRSGEVRALCGSPSQTANLSGLVLGCVEADICKSITS